MFVGNPKKYLYPWKQTYLNSRSHLRTIPSHKHRDKSHQCCSNQPSDGTQRNSADTRLHLLNKQLESQNFLVPESKGDSAGMIPCECYIQSGFSLSFKVDSWDVNVGGFSTECYRQFHAFTFSLYPVCPKRRLKPLSSWFFSRLRNLTLTIAPFHSSTS